MITDEDRKYIKEIIEELLTVEVKYEKRRDEKTGQKLAIPEIITKKEFLPIWWMKYLPYYEGAIRGMQETLDKYAGQLKNLTERFDNLDQGMLLMIETTSELNQSTKQLSGSMNQQIEFTPESKLSKLVSVINSKESSEAERNKAKNQFKTITGADYK